MRISKRQKAELLLAKKLGVIEKDDETSLLSLMNENNSKLNSKSFGKTSFNEVNFLGYLIARFKMSFVFMELEYDYRKITAEEIKRYYEDYRLEFLREDQNYFPLEEIELVVLKRLREIEYEEIVNGLLHRQ